MIPPVLLPGDVFQRVRLPNAAGVEGKYVRIASVSGDLAQLEWVNNSASDITEGTLAAARLPATAVQTTGSYADPAWVTALAASKITGTMMKSQQHAQTPYKDEANTWAQAQTFNDATLVSGSGLSRIQSDGSATPSGMSGVGLESFAVAGKAWVTSYNRTSNAYAPIVLYGSTVEVNGNSTFNGTVTIPNSGVIRTVDGAKLSTGGGLDPWLLLNQSDGALGLKVGSLVISSAYYNTAPTNGLFVQGSFLAGSGSFAVTDDYHLATYASAKIGWTDTGGVTTASTVNMHLARKDSSTIEIRKANGSVGDFSAGAATFNGAASATEFRPTVGSSDWSAASFSLSSNSLFVNSKSGYPGYLSHNATGILRWESDRVEIFPTAASTGVGTGALQVAGGIYAAAASVFQGATFNGQISAASGIAVSGKIQISTNASGFGSTLSNGSSQFYNSLTAGLIIAGAGSTSDLLITNKSGGDVFSIPTGTVNADFAGSVSALALNADAGSNKPLRSYRDVSYSGWYNGASLASNEAYYMGSSTHYFSVGGTNRLEVGSSSQFSGNLTVTGLLNGHTAKLGDFTVATLPSAASNAGYEANVTDSSVTTFGSTVAGSGSSRVKVYSNGTNWTVQAA